MKKIIIIATISLLASFLFACESNSTTMEASETLQSAQTQAIIDAVDALPGIELSDELEEGLVFMREEEKLARDVYLYFYQKYGSRIFNNIANSESTHMAALKALLDKYNIKDPVLSDEIGVFQNEELATLFNQLTTAGDVSLLDAFKIGATIEDLDIRDLMSYESQITNEDVIYVYENLTKGSRNHLRAYYRQITNNGGTYEPQFISQELFEYIINSPHERGRW